MPLYCECGRPGCPGDLSCGEKLARPESGICPMTNTKPPNTQSPPPPATNEMPDGFSMEDLRNPKYHSRVSTFWMTRADQIEAAANDAREFLAAVYGHAESPNDPEALRVLAELNRALDAKYGAVECGGCGGLKRWPLMGPPICDRCQR